MHPLQILKNLDNSNKMLLDMSTASKQFETRQIKGIALRQINITCKLIEKGIQMTKPILYVRLKNEGFFDLPKRTLPRINPAYIKKLYAR